MKTKLKSWLVFFFLALAAVVCLAPTVQMRTSSGIVGTVPYWTNGPFLSQTSPMVVSNNFVGIGTNGPVRLLHLAKTGGSFAGLRITDFAANGNEWDVGSRQHVAGDFSIRNISSNATYFFIDAPGNVGIGTTSPSAGFHVANTALIRTNVALLDVTTNLFVLDALNTNSNRRGWVSASISLSAAAAGTAKVSLVVEHGTMITNRLTVSAGPLASLVTIEPLMLPLSPNAVFYFTNETSGAGASVAIVTDTCSLVGF